MFSRLQRKKSHQGASATGLGEGRPRPKHLNVWDHNAYTARKALVLAIVNSVVVLVSVGAAIAALNVAFYHPLVYYVDAAGQVTTTDRVSVDGALREREAEWVTKHYLRNLFAIDSRTVHRDFAEAELLMTPAAREAFTDVRRAYEAETGKTFEDMLAAKRTATTLEFDRIQVNPSSDGQLFQIHVIGRTKSWPLDGTGQNSVTVQKRFETRLSLVTVPRTEATPNGLAGDYPTLQLSDLPSRAERLEETAPGLEASE